MAQNEINQLPRLNAGNRPPGKDDCEICGEEFARDTCHRGVHIAVRLPCAHLMCLKCVTEWAVTKLKMTCPFCRSTLYAPLPFCELQRSPSAREDAFPHLAFFGEIVTQAAGDFVWGLDGIQGLPDELFTGVVEDVSDAIDNSDHGNWHLLGLEMVLLQAMRERVDADVPANAVYHTSRRGHPWYIWSKQTIEAMFVSFVNACIRIMASEAPYDDNDYEFFDFDGEVGEPLDDANQAEEDDESESGSSENESDGESDADVEPDEHGEAFATTIMGSDDAVGHDINIWACPMCTLENPIGQTQCGACKHPDPNINMDDANEDEGDEGSDGSERAVVEPTNGIYSNRNSSSNGNPFGWTDEEL